MKALAALLLLLAPAARAQFGGPCDDDVLKYCGARRGVEAEQACLARHGGTLSGFCRAAGGGAKTGPRRDAEDFKKACGVDARLFCAESQGGWAVTMKCLTLHARDISQKCRDYGNALRAKYEEAMTVQAREECSVDGRRLCPGKDFDRGLGDCLVEHASRLSARCRKGLDTLRRMDKLKAAEKRPPAGAPKAP